MTSNNKRIVKNSLFLYIRMLFLTILTLYTSRVVLEQLGVEDFGIYSIVGGIVTMLSFFNSSMSVATQRYMAFDIGRNDFKRLNKTFNSSLFIYIFIGLLIVILLETVGLWYINNRLVFPEEKTFSVNVVYQFSILTFLVNLTQLPYNALILAREKMQVYTYVTILDTILKLAILYLLFLGENKLILYSILVFVVTVIVQLVYHIYCHKRFEETKINFTRDKEYLKELLSFSGWNLFGNIAAVARNQGINLVLNIFFGVMLNAAYAIAIQVQNAVGSFVANFQKAMNPQIIKSYANGQNNEALKLMSAGVKYSFFLMILFAAPLLIHTEYVLNLWLTELPEHSVVFVRLVIAFSMVESISGPLMTMVQATGKIKWYQIVIGGLIFLNLPISYFLMKVNNRPETFYYVMISIGIICLIIRVLFLKKMIGLKISEFILKTIIPIIMVSFLILSLWYLLESKISIINRLDTLVFNVIIEILICVFVILTIGLNINEKRMLLTLARKYMKI
ncbi:MATE family efflux transporter [Sinomicrobium sp. M5D2P9]